MRLVEDMDTPELDDGEAPADLAEMIRKKQIVEQTAELTGMSKGEVRRVLDAGLGVMRDFIEDGKDVHYPTLGKLRIKHPERDGAKPQVRLSLAKPPSPDAVDDGADEGDDEV